MKNDQTNCGHLLELDRRAKDFGRARAHRREFYGILEKEAGKHFTGLVGARGAGKTFLSQQLVESADDGFYLSADSLERGADLFEVVRELSGRYR